MPLQDDLAAVIILVQDSDRKLFLKLEIVELWNRKRIPYQNSPRCSAFLEPGQGTTFKLQRKLRDHWEGNKENQA